MKTDDLGAMFIIMLLVGLLMLAGASLNQAPTSNWWKAEIVRRGYGTWETTTDGQVWFKWKEQSPKEEPK